MSAMYAYVPQKGAMLQWIKLPCNLISFIKLKIQTRSNLNCSEKIKILSISSGSQVLTFYMLNSAEHKIYPAYVNILTFISMINTPSEIFKARNFFGILVFMSSWKFVLS